MTTPQRYKALVCEALARPAYACAATSPHVVDIELLRYGLHNQPADLRAHLQAAIDAADAQEYAAVLFAYGLCGQAIAGLTARRLPLVIPRAHDCITLFLGSRARYTEEFTRNPGTYWYVQDYLERQDGSGSALSIGAGSDSQLSGVYEEYVAKYGRDNADYLMDVMGAWQQHYNRAAYIDLGVAESAAIEERARQEAARRGWTFERMAGDLTLIRRLLHGEWDDDYLIVPPGNQVRMSAGEEVIACHPPAGG